MLCRVCVCILVLVSMYAFREDDFQTRQHEYNTPGTATTRLNKLIVAITQPTRFHSIDSLNYHITPPFDCFKNYKKLALFTTLINQSARHWLIQCNLHNISKGCCQRVKKEIVKEREEATLRDSKIKTAHC